MNKRMFRREMMLEKLYTKERKRLEKTGEEEIASKETIKQAVISQSLTSK